MASRLALSSSSTASTSCRLFDAMPTPFAPSEVAPDAPAARRSRTPPTASSATSLRTCCSRAPARLLCDFGRAGGAAQRRAHARGGDVVVPRPSLLGATTYGARSTAGRWPHVRRAPPPPAADAGHVGAAPAELMCALSARCRRLPEFPALPLTPKVQLPQPYNELLSWPAKARPTGAALPVGAADLRRRGAAPPTARSRTATAEPPAAVVPDRAVPSSAKGASRRDGRQLARRSTAARLRRLPRRKRPREARLPSPASVAAEEPRKL